MGQFLGPIFRCFCCEFQGAYPNHHCSSNPSNQGANFQSFGPGAAGPSATWWEARGEWQDVEQRKEKEQQHKENEKEKQEQSKEDKEEEQEQQEQGK